VRRLRRLLVLMVAVVTVVPTGLFIWNEGGVDPLQGLRVFGIHLVVASALVLVIYAVPMRALQRAIVDLEATQEQVLHANRLGAIGKVYASLAHEINNPLAIIQSRVRLVLEGAHQPPLPAGVIRDLETIERHGARIAELVRSFLAFARKTPAGLVRTDLNQVARETVRLVRTAFSKDGIEIEEDLWPALPAVLGNASQLQQVLLNLLNNARDAMPGGGRVRICTQLEAGQVLVEVQDTGTGIAPDVLDKIFDPFFTTKEVGKGTGLGLSVSYGIVTAHGGSISVRSAPGQGAAFRLTLPLSGGRA
jgi:signal transduction histidine kinase